MLLRINQAARGAAGGVLVLVLIGSAIAVGAAVAGAAALAAVLAPVLLLILAFSFQTYGEVSVTGAARAVLERRVAELLGGVYPLVYEYAVADIRKRPPLVFSVRALQLATVMAVVVVVGVGVGGVLGHDWSIVLGYFAAVLVAGTVAGLSYRAMLASGTVARARLEERLAPGTGSGPHRQDLA